MAIIGDCIEVAHISEHLYNILSKFPKKSRYFVLVDIDKYTVFKPDTGFYECKDIQSVKNLLHKLLNELKLNIDRVYIGKGTDEKWLENNIHLFTQRKIDTSSIGVITRGKILAIIPTKKGVLIRRYTSLELILNVIELYTKIR